LTEEEKQQYPWNFEWNFNWLWGINDGSNYKKMAKEAQKRKEESKEQTAENRQLVVEWIAKRENMAPSNFPIYSVPHPKPLNRVGAAFWKREEERQRKEFEAKQKQI